MIINIITANTTNVNIPKLWFQTHVTQEDFSSEVRKIRKLFNCDLRIYKETKTTFIWIIFEGNKNNWQGEICRLVSGLGWIVALSTSDSWVIVARLLRGIFCQQNRINSIRAALRTSLKNPGEEEGSPLHAQKLSCQKKASNFAV